MIVAERLSRQQRPLRRLHATYRRRMQTLLKSLEAHMPAGVEWTSPMGGATLWMRVPQLNPAEEEKVLAAAADEGVTLSPGSLFFPTPTDAVASRLSIARIKAHEIDDGCRRLARALRCVLPA
jgi:2-aminoadipate transaminase